MEIFHLNSLNLSLRFTFQKECNRTLPFIDVLVEKNDHEFVTSIYRKPTFTGQYIRWNSFCPMKPKTNLISILVHRTLVICSKSTFQNYAMLYKKMNSYGIGVQQCGIVNHA